MPEEEVKAPETAPEPEEKMIPQSQVDRIVQDRLNRDRAKYSDYDDLRKKVESFEKQQEQLSQQELEKKQEYDKLKDGWTQKESEYQTKLNEAMAQVRNERVSNTLTNEALRQNAYPETVKLLKDVAQYHDDGTVTIRGKDANGMDADLPVEQGVQQFLKERPYLVKGSAQGGGGTSQGGGGNAQVEENLSELLQNAMAVNDRKKIAELKQKIREKHHTQGFSKIL